jgi:hypothetical protein
MNDRQPTWKLQGTVLIACNCDYGCPCNFNARPSRGKCEGGWTWHVERGMFDGVSLDGLNFSVYANWPGAIHEGNGEAVILVDECANDRQRDAITTLVGGNVGGPWGVLAWTWPKVHGPLPVAYELLERNRLADEGRQRRRTRVDLDQESGQRQGRAPTHDPARRHHRQRGGPRILEGISDQ